ncbi:MAG: UDP-N-acetylglucosamine--N-acetylmuramyl-(pentapeptide) pyrophosphoryl-undecaprenol N-acetylglucosamine transferase [Fretibacterium sp.]|nr:UDP-N-acetylglucosamine--N-acetylmuramyl-(pentapeptide) pyrophosphoryl-undecaprenol N-acetylglucosamine transferase [Fretibacterium sp.]
MSGQEEMPEREKSLSWKNMRVLIVAGGTGGHIFPAAVFGRWLEAEQGATVSYLCGSRPLEQDIYTSMGLKPHCLSLVGSPAGTRSFWKRLRRSFDVLASVFETRAVLREEAPDVCFLFGGYVSFAPLLLCRMKKIPLLLHEQNSVAGRVTRLASRLGVTIASGWKECSGVEGFIPVGIPVRPVERVERGDAMKRLGLDLPQEARVVGVIGGSLSSQPLMDEVIKIAGLFQDLFFVFLGAPPGDFEQGVGKKLGKWLSEKLCFLGRRWDVNAFYSLCDFLVCRSGASTLAEAMAWNIPALTVPWRGATDGHQERNARNFEALTGNRVWDEGVDPSGRALEKLLHQPNPPLKPDFGQNACAAIWHEALKLEALKKTGKR